MSRIDKVISRASQIPFIKGKHRIYSMIYDKKGKLLSEAGNSYTKSSPKMKAFALEVGFEEKEYWHSECLAIHRIPYGTAPYRIVIARVNRNGEALLAAPCPVCLNQIKNKGIRVIEHTV